MEYVCYEVKKKNKRIKQKEYTVDSTHSERTQLSCTCSKFKKKRKKKQRNTIFVYGTNKITDYYPANRKKKNQRQKI